MFRRSQSTTRSAQSFFRSVNHSTVSVLFRTNFPINLFAGNFATRKNESVHKLLDAARILEEQGEVRIAEIIYKKIIYKMDPSCKEAYEKLWNSWATNRSLKVTEKELNDFKTSFKQNIEPGIESTSLGL